LESYSGLGGSRGGFRLWDASGQHGPRLAQIVVWRTLLTLPALFRRVVSVEGFIASEVVQSKKMRKNQQKRRRRQKTKNKKKGYIATGIGSNL
jgi:hypothetical protein